jgi:probable HAF family extracellular repeat protein
MRKKLTLLMAMICLTVLGGTTQAAATRYLYKDLGTLGGDMSDALGINDVGQVAGVAQTLNGDPHAFLKSPMSPMRDLGTLGGAAGGMSWAYAVNQFVVGVSSVVIGTIGTDHAFRWSPSHGMQDLGALEFPENASYAYGTNKSGIVVGESNVSSIFVTHAFRWEKGVMKDLGTFGGKSSRARCINDNGEIAGSFTDPVTYSYRGFLLQPSGAWQNLGNLGGPATDALGINNTGHVVGWSNEPNYSNRAFLWTPSLGMEDLGTLGGNNSTANGINNVDQVVGWAENAKPEVRAFVWTKQAGMQDLNKLTVNLPPNVVLKAARAINNNGQIVGMASVSLLDHAFLLTPVNVSNVPNMMFLLLLLN